MKGFSLELGTGAAGQKLERWATRPTKKFDDNFSRVDRMHERDWGWGCFVTVRGCALYSLPF